MNRRDLIKLIAGAVAAKPLGANAQQPAKVYRIGFLANDPTIPDQPAGKAFMDGLRENGFIDGKNVAIDYRFAQGLLDRYPHLVADLAQRNVDLIVSSSNEATLALIQATVTTIPIVMINGQDPVGKGFVKSIAHPGGNITGLTMEASSEVATKRLQLLKDALPNAVLIGVLMNPDLDYDGDQWRMLERAAGSLNMKLRSLAARRISDFESAIASVAGVDGADALFVVSSGLNFANRELILAPAAKTRLPVMSNFKETTQAGGLMSYGADRVDLFKRAAIYAGKILKGAKPGDLPIEEPTKYELVINLKAAKTLNLAIPRPLLLIADEVIE
jgi:putative ABC transport system substrate-binding protein